MQAVCKVEAVNEPLLVLTTKRLFMAIFIVI
jgi:hypothetical protein